jgi:hypothetical protein
MKKFEVNLSEDAAAVFWIVLFGGVGVWGISDAAVHGIQRWYQLPLLLLFGPVLCFAGIVMLRKQSRLRTCPKCQTLMERAAPQGDGIRRQRCPNCNLVLKTGVKGSLVTLDQVDETT